MEQISQMLLLTEIWLWSIPEYDECKQRGAGPCYPMAKCTSDASGYKCECGDGFDENCDDIDECATLDDACEGEKTECVNFEGGFVCKCRAGFQFDDKMGCVGKLFFLSFLWNYNFYKLFVHKFISMTSKASRFVFLRRKGKFHYQISSAFCTVNSKNKL